MRRATPKRTTKTRRQTTTATPSPPTSITAPARGRGHNRHREGAAWSAAQQAQGWGRRRTADAGATPAAAEARESLEITGEQPARLRAAEVNQYTNTPHRSFNPSDFERGFYDGLPPAGGTCTPDEFWDPDYQP